MKKRGHLILILAMPVILILGYGVMHGMFYALPLRDGSGLLYVLVSLAVIGLGLSVPFWFLKAGFSGAHRADPHETTFELKDIPKDTKQMARK